jgi:hypothetical protein
VLGVHLIWGSSALDDALLALLLKRRADQEDYAAMVGTTLVPDPFILSPGGSRRQAARPRHSDGLLQADGKQGWHRNSLPRAAPLRRHDGDRAGTDVSTVAWVMLTRL